MKMKHLPAVAALAMSLAIAPVRANAARTSADGFNSEYVYATTRSVSDMDVNPALKLTLFPVTIVLDTVFLPFALIAGVVA